MALLVGTVLVTAPALGAAAKGRTEVAANKRSRQATAAPRVFDSGLGRHTTNDEVSRSPRGLSADESGEQRISRRDCKRKGRRLSAPAKS